MLRSGILLPLALFIGAVLAAADDGITVVKIKQGSLSGITEESRNGRKYFAFKGIPYGKVPKRFEEAIAAPSWGTESLNASTFGPPCPQFDFFSQSVIGDENCLSLNVFTQSLSKEKKQAVLVKIHGGGFQWGTGAHYGASLLMDEPDFILVTLNYRLGPFGFLSTEDSVVPGNMGLKDQNLALRWIQENIDAFGGDKDKVTIIGSSAGGASVSHHIVSPKSAGLFHQAIPISGSVLNPWALHPEPKRDTKVFGEKLKCPIDKGSAELVDCLRKLDFKDLAKVSLTKWYLDSLCPFRPVVEKGNEKQAFVSTHPLESLKDGNINKISSIVTGFNKDEGLLFHAAGVLIIPQLQKDMNEKWNDVLPVTLFYDDVLTNDELKGVSQGIRDYYFGSAPIGNLLTFPNLTAMYGDRYFNYGVKKTALLYTNDKKGTGIKVYPFIFGYEGEWSIIQAFYGEEKVKKPLGVSHWDNIRYLFPHPWFRPLKPDTQDDDFSKKLVKAVADYVKTGKLAMPSGEEWTPIGEEVKNTDKINWYFIDDKSQVVREPPVFTDRMNFWMKKEDEIANLIKFKIKK